jgi:predicted enzyme related to lactoylglutathione lyase
MPPPLIEFPADDPDRARQFWHGVLGVTLAQRPTAAGSGWETDTDGLRLGVHQRGPGPGDTACLPYFTVADLAMSVERVRELGGSIIHPASGGPCAGTPRAARSRWPPRPAPGSSTATIAVRALQHSWSGYFGTPGRQSSGGADGLPEPASLWAAGTCRRLRGLWATIPTRCSSRPRDGRSMRPWRAG